MFVVLEKENFDSEKTHAACRFVVKESRITEIKINAVTRGNCYDMTSMCVYAKGKERVRNERKERLSLKEA